MSRLSKCTSFFFVSNGSDTQRHIYIYIHTHFFGNEQGPKFGVPKLKDSHPFLRIKNLSYTKYVQICYYVIRFCWDILPSKKKQDPPLPLLMPGACE